MITDLQIQEMSEQLEIALANADKELAKIVSIKRLPRDIKRRNALKGACDALFRYLNA